MTTPTTVPSTKITVRSCGPYLIQGPIDIVDSDGRSFTVRAAVVALCRCGASTTKPFCDGTHLEIGFGAPAPALEDVEES